jgi:hypothetical protein
MCVSTNPETRGPVEGGAASVPSPDPAKVEFSDCGIGLYNPSEASDGRDIE